MVLFLDLRGPCDGEVDILDAGWAIQHVVILGSKNRFWSVHHFEDGPTESPDRPPIVLVQELYDVQPTLPCLVPRGEGLRLRSDYRKR
jgi:hypothetical protein